MEINTTILAAQPFFKGLSEEHLKLLVDNAGPAEFKAGELIFKEGADADRFYLIYSGRVALESPTRQESEPFLVETIGGGSILGWAWLFPPYYWHFDARAVTPVKAIFFDGTHLRELCEADHDLGYEIAKRAGEVVIDRLQATRRRLGQENKKILMPV